MAVPLYELHWQIPQELSDLETHVHQSRPFACFIELAWSLFQEECSKTDAPRNKVDFSDSPLETLFQDFFSRTSNQEISRYFACY